MAAGEGRFITFAFGELVVAAMAFQRARREQLAALASRETAGVIVVFQVRGEFGFDRP